MITKISREVWRAFILNESTINAIWSIVSQKDDRAYISVTCSDGTEFITSEIKKLLDFPNYSKRHIRRVHMYTGHSSERDLNVKFSDLPYITYEIRCEEDTAFSIERNLQDAIDHSVPWYSKYTNYTTYQIILNLFIYSILWFIIQLVFPRKYQMSISYISSYFSIPLAFLAFSGLVSSLSMFLVSHIVIRFFFPRAQFLIGDGIRRANSVQNRRKIVIGILGSLLLSLAGNFIYEKFISGTSP